MVSLLYYIYTFEYKCALLKESTHTKKTHQSFQQKSHIREKQSKSLTNSYTHTFWYNKFSFHFCPQ